MIRAGRMRHSVIFKVKTVIKNSYGEEEDIFTPLFRTRCEIISVQQTNSILAAGLEKESNISLRLRFTRKLTAQLFFEINGVTYEVKSFENQGNLNKEILIDGIAFI